MPRQYEDSATRRLQVAQAALVALAEGGAARFTTKAIARQVGMSDGSLFRHFGSKEEIVLAALDLLEVELDTSLVSSGDAYADLEAFFRHRAAFVGAERSVGRLIFSDELVHLAGEAGRARVAAWRQRSHRFLVDCLDSLQADGRAVSTVNAQAMAMFIQGSLLTFAMQAALGRGGSPAELQVRVDGAWAALRALLFPNTLGAGRGNAQHATPGTF